MGGNGTNQQKHRENKKKTIFQRSWGWGGLAQSKKSIEKTQYSRGLGDGGVPPRVSKYCYFFFGFLNVFLISLHGVLPKETQSIFLCYHYMEVYTVFFRLWY